MRKKTNIVEFRRNVVTDLHNETKITKLITLPTQIPINSK